MQTMNANPIKFYVPVSVHFKEDGTMLPRTITWEDGAKQKIDRVSDIRPAATLKTGGQSDRYTVWIGNQKSYLFFERNATASGGSIGRWFVERRGA